MRAGDTIAAISTPPGRGGIGVIRISGPAALETAVLIFKPRSAEPLGSPALARVGKVFGPASGEVLDSAILTYFKAPHSYTGEDVVELSCHGSPIILGRVLEMLLARGARPAEPGEFTLRAFLNKRIDLAQAQAVKDLIDAQTEFQVRLVTRQMEGALSRQLSPIKDALVNVIVHLESSIEFVEDDISPEAASLLEDKLEGLIDRIAAIAASFSLGKYVREGFDLVIVGKPNVGKSSVFNRLIGRDRAIITEIAGTTRDALYEATSISGVPVRLIDTAGIRETSDIVETIGINRTRTAIAEADVALLVLDASEPISADDNALLGEIPLDKRIVVLNKSDLPRRMTGPSGEPCLLISAITGEGFDLLLASIMQRLAGDSSIERDDILITDVRQHSALRRAIPQLEEAKAILNSGGHEEVILLKLRSALEAIGEITGETLTEDILGQIFATFCIGK